jgi:rubredoxin
MIIDSFNYKRNEVEPTEYPEGVTGIPDEDEDIEVPVEPVKEEVVEEVPTVWSCPICTFENAL